MKLHASGNMFLFLYIALSSCLMQVYLSAKELRDKADESKDSMRELRAEFDKKIEEMQNKLDKSMKSGKETVNDVKERINTGRSMMMDVLESDEDAVREHPMIAVGGVFVVGLLIGALFSRKSSH